MVFAFFLSTLITKIMYLFPKSAHNLLSAVISNNTSFSAVHDNTDPVFGITGEVYDEDDNPDHEYYEVEIKDYPKFFGYVDNSFLPVESKKQFLALLFLSI